MHRFDAIMYTICWLAVGMALGCTDNYQGSPKFLIEGACTNEKPVKGKKILCVSVLCPRLTWPSLTGQLSPVVRVALPTGHAVAG